MIGDRFLLGVGDDRNECDELVHLLSILDYSSDDVGESDVSVFPSQFQQEVEDRLLMLMCVGWGWEYSDHRHCCDVLASFEDQCARTVTLSGGSLGFVLVLGTLTFLF